MNYLDYLSDYRYDELPAAIQLEISRDDYDLQRAIAGTLAEQAPPVGLPPVLKAAFQAKQQSKTVVVKRGAWRWAAAAGWLLFAVALAFLIEQQPQEKIVYELVSTPLPTPIVVHQTDTFVKTKTHFKKYWDTVYLEAPSPPAQIVVQQDTVYVPAAETPLIRAVSGSQSLLGKEQVLEFLVGTD